MLHKRVLSIGVGFLTLLWKPVARVALCAISMGPTHAAPAALLFVFMYGCDERVLARAHIAKTTWRTMRVHVNTQMFP